MGNEGWNKVPLEIHKAYPTEKELNRFEIKYCEE